MNKREIADMARRLDHSCMTEMELQNRDLRTRLSALEKENAAMRKVVEAARIHMAKLVHDNEDAGALDNWMTPEYQILYEALSPSKGVKEKVYVDEPICKCGHSHLEHFANGACGFTDAGGRCRCLGFPMISASAKEESK